MHRPENRISDQQPDGRAVVRHLRKIAARRRRWRVIVGWLRLR